MKIYLFASMLILGVIFSTDSYSAMKSIDSENDFKANIEKSGQNVNLVMFGTGWCGYCKKLKPIINELSEKYAGKMNFYLVDAEKLESVAKQYGINYYPVVLFMKNGKEQDRMLGYNDKAYVEDLIKKNIK